MPVGLVIVGGGLAIAVIASLLGKAKNQRDVDMSLDVGPLERLRLPRFLRRRRRGRR